MEKILVTAVGSLSADIVIKELHRAGYYIVGTDIYPKEWVVDAYNVDGFYQVPKAYNTQTYIDKLMSICKTENIRYIIPLTDVEVDVLNARRASFENNGICICISDKMTIDICRNKKWASDRVRENTECKVIPKLNKEQINDSNVYPIVCKPVNGRSSLGVKYFNSPKEANAFLSEINWDGYVIQPYIKGEIITVDIVRNAKTKRCIAVARKELLRTTNGLGITVKMFRDRELEELCCQIADILEINGCVNFEFIEDEEGNRFFMECNPRFSGGVEYSVMSGYNCVINHLRCFINKEIHELNGIKEQYIARKYEEYITKYINN